MAGGSVRSAWTNITQAPRALAMFAQSADERGGDSLAPVRLSDGEIVDVDLAARLFELLELVGDEATHDRRALERDEHQNVGLGQDPREVGIARRPSLVGVTLAERRAEHRVERPGEQQVGCSELLDRGRHTKTLARASKAFSSKRSSPDRVHSVVNPQVLQAGMANLAAGPAGRQRKAARPGIACSASALNCGSCSTPMLS